MICFTLGHSNLPWTRFIRLLRLQGVTRVLDVRPHPEEGPSRFHRHHLEWMLPPSGISYAWLGDDLGGELPAKGLPAPVNLDRRDLMHRQPTYIAGWLRLVQDLRDFPGPTCLLGSTENPLRCHRHWLIGQDLAALGVEVLHIRGTRKGPTQVLKVLPPATPTATPATRHPHASTPPQETWTDPIRPVSRAHHPES